MSIIFIANFFALNVSYNINIILLKLTFIIIAIINIIINYNLLKKDD